MSEAQSVEQLRQLLTRVSERLDADVAVYLGDIAVDADIGFVDLCCKRTRRQNVLLILTTYGGSAHAAFRMARCLQEHYKRFIVYVRHHCKSAGTLFALGADDLIMSDRSELGPLDVQVQKPDEFGEMQSGLTLSQALNTLQVRAAAFWAQQFVNVRGGSSLRISTRLATEVATTMTVGVFSQIYSQIDPLRLGEIDRDLRVAKEYADRLGSRNLKHDAVDRLIANYPSHGFVIDKKEAEKLFQQIREPSDDERTLFEGIEERLYKYEKLMESSSGDFGTAFSYLDDEINEIEKEEAEENDKHVNGEDRKTTSPQGSGSSTSDGTTGSEFSDGSETISTVAGNATDTGEKHSGGASTHHK